MAVNKDDAVNIAAAPTVEKPATGGPGAWGSLMRFLREVRVELKKTNWPSRNDLTKSTVVVMATILFMAVYLFVCDTVVGHFMQWALQVQK